MCGVLGSGGNPNASRYFYAQNRLFTNWAREQRARLRKIKPHLYGWRFRPSRPGALKLPGCLLQAAQDRDSF